MAVFVLEDVTLRHVKDYARREQYKAFCYRLLQLTDPAGLVTGHLSYTTHTNDSADGGEPIESGYRKVSHSRHT